MATPRSYQHCDIISKAILNQIEKKSFNYFDFIFGRIKRIVPAYFVMLLIVSLAGFFILCNFDKLAILYDLRKSLVFTSNQVFAKSNDYFGARTVEKAFLHTWSLAIEMQFYLVLPLIMMYVPKSILKWLLIFGSLAIFCYTQYQIDFLLNKSAMYFSVNFWNLMSAWRNSRILRSWSALENPRRMGSMSMIFFSHQSQ